MPFIVFLYAPELSTLEKLLINFHALKKGGDYIMGGDLIKTRTDIAREQIRAELESRGGWPWLFSFFLHIPKIVLDKIGGVLR